MWAAVQAIPVVLVIQAASNRYKYYVKSTMAYLIKLYMPWPW